MIIIQVYVSEHWHSPKMFWFVGWFFGMTHLLHVRVHQVVVSGGYRSSDEGSGPSKGSRDPSERS